MLRNAWATRRARRPAAGGASRVEPRESAPRRERAAPVAIDASEDPALAKLHRDERREWPRLGQLAANERSAREERRTSERGTPRRGRDDRDDEACPTKL